MLAKMRIIQQSFFHLIIASNDGKKFLTRVNQDILFNYINSMLYNMKCKPLKVTGNSEHVHIVLSLPPHLSPLLVLKEIQQNTLDFIRRENSVFPEFTGWSTGYCAVSVHNSQLDSLIADLDNHFDYHRKIGFEEELDLLSSNSLV